jgi:peptidoglycan/xylan/chitin deacetylase (PgdA/CDA1 family)
VVLLYHRVIEGCSDPWGLCVSPEKFAQQLAVLSKYTKPIKLQELVAALKVGAILPRSVVVTFDDGYADNFQSAKPLLERYNIPATVFVATDYVGGGREFWWDELDRLLLQPGTLPEVLRLTVGGTIKQWELAEAARYSETHRQRDSAWKAPDNPPSKRHSLFVSLWQLLQPMRESERRHVLEELRAWAGAEAGFRSTHRTLSMEELMLLQRGDLVEVGSHTMTHPVLPEFSAALQRDELQRSKARLEELLGHPLTSFAYPYGAYAAETVPIVRETGYACACSTHASVVTRGTDCYQLPRLEVQDWDGEEFSRRLSLWFDSK